MKKYKYNDESAKKEENPIAKIVIVQPTEDTRERKSNSSNYSYVPMGAREIKKWFVAR